MNSRRAVLELRGGGKTFFLHLRGGTQISAFRNVNLCLYPGECLVLRGPSGAGKSSLMRAVYGNYRLERGSAMIRHRDGWADLASASPRDIIEIRRETMGYVSQFLRVIPRVPAREIVAAPLISRGLDRMLALVRADAMLERLNLPRKLWDLPPATFSGGEQQRVNIARGFVGAFPVLLLDEPTASLDDANRTVIVKLVEEATRSGAAVLAILHDRETHEAVATRFFDLEPVEIAA